MVELSDPQQAVSKFFNEVGGLGGFSAKIAMAIITGYVLARFINR